MKKHVKIYLDHFGYGEQDFISCEICGKKATDVHHLDNRGMGGSKEKDYIENLMGLCRGCHKLCEDSPDHNELAKNIHQHQLEKNY